MEKTQCLEGRGWNAARTFLPFDLDGFAQEHGALQRRRGVVNGEALVRTLCFCALPKVNLERGAGMAREAGVSCLGKTAMFKRLANSEGLLRALFKHALGQALDRSEKWCGFNLVAVDATTLCGPGAKGTDQRLHVVYDLGRALPRSVELTGPEGGETLARHHSFGFDDLLLSDRGYGHERGIMSAMRSGARVLIRFRFETIRMFRENDDRIWPEAAEAVVPSTGAVEIPVYLEKWPAPFRAIGERNLDGEAVWFLTDLSREELPADEVRNLYSRRWQVELFFKRLKSIIDLDELPTRNGPTARSWIWAKLLVATLAVLLTSERFSPWGHASEPLESHVPRLLGNDSRYPRSISPGLQTGPSQRKKTKARKNAQATLLLEA